jgi:hypothetical protein
MLLHVQQASTAATFIASPCVLAVAFLALACRPFLAFINICHKILASAVQHENKGEM